MNKEDLDQIPVTIDGLKEYIKRIKRIAKRWNDLQQEAERRLDVAKRSLNNFK